MPVITARRLRPYKIKATVRESSEEEGINETYWYSIEVHAPNSEAALIEATEKMEDYFDYYDCTHPSQPDDLERNITVSITNFGDIVQVDENGNPLSDTSQEKH